MSFLPALDKTDPPETSIVKFIKQQGIIHAQELADYLGTSRNTAIRKLNKIIDAGIIVKTGSARSIRYQLKGEA